jgi:lipopolysaccharide transport system ATP-binding protein
MNAIEVNHVSKRYSLARSPVRRLLDLTSPPNRNHQNDFWALRDVTFSVPQGESFGILGPNGSGKSTLLQILARVMEPTSGTVIVNGRVSAILELGAGFNPDFSGRANVRMNASILGLNEAEIDQRFEQIEEFAEIGDFIDRPVRTYSSGMVMRLAFSVAVHIDPQVLIVDEALAVGDIYFQQRCLRYLHRLRDRGITLAFVSHAPTELRALCSRCLWLDRGQVRELGETAGVMSRYLANSAGQKTAATSPAVSTEESVRCTRLALSVTEESTASPLVAPVGNGSYRYGTRLAELLGADVVDTAGKQVPTAAPGELIVVRIHFRANRDIPHPNAGFLMRNERGETVYGTNSTREGKPLAAMKAGAEMLASFEFQAPKFATGRYAFTVGIVDGTLTEFEIGDYIEDALGLNFGDVRDTANTSDGTAGYLQFDYDVRTYKVDRETKLHREASGVA